MRGFYLLGDEEPEPIKETPMCIEECGKELESDDEKERGVCDPCREKDEREFRAEQHEHKLRDQLRRHRRMRRLL